MASSMREYVKGKQTLAAVSRANVRKPPVGMLRAHTRVGRPHKRRRTDTVITVERVCTAIAIAVAWAGSIALILFTFLVFRAALLGV